MARFVSEKNLILAWNRISTGLNHQHKRYFRHLYAAYATALTQNLRDLSARLRHGSYAPQEPTRIFLPKASGLQRPLTLLYVEDQIVLQAMANVFADRVSTRRRSLELKAVYSNVLGPQRNRIFFLRDWHDTYEAFTRRIRDLYRKGFKWIVEFDLAAYYDTISHDLLLRTVFPRGGLRQQGSAFVTWLNTWTSETSTGAHAHGIPQGPVASDFLAECFMLPVDEAMTRRHAYLRYVDDVRLFGRTEREVRLAALELEVLCRNRGLIPQAKKFEIRAAKSVDEVLHVLPSLTFATDVPDGQASSIPGPRAVAEFRKALSGRPRRISDRTRARYVLYRAAASRRLLRYVLLLMPHHPEHIDAFAYYVSHFPRDQTAIAVCTGLVRDSPYGYVRGEAWQILARMMTSTEMGTLTQQAIAVARGRDDFSAKWGACTFLCAAEHEGLGEYSKWSKYQRNALLQALIAPILPRRRFRAGDVVPQMLARSSAEPGLALAARLVVERCSLRTLGIRAADLPGVVQRTYQAIGLLRGPATRTEPIAELLQRSLAVVPWKGWRRLLSGEYGHACQLLAQAVPVLDSGRSLWLIQQNSFDHAVFLAFQQWLLLNGRPGTVTLRRPNGELLSFGVLVQRGNAFSRSYPAVADILRDLNARRNTVPEAHPYATKTGRRTVPLTKKEQQLMIPRLRSAFGDIARVVG